MFLSEKQIILLPVDQHTTPKRIAFVPHLKRLNMILSVILFGCFLLVLDFLWRKQKDMKSKIPGPSPYPFVGSLFRYWNMTSETLLEKVVEESHRYGGCFRSWMGYTPMCLISAPEDIEVLLNNTKHIRKNEMYELLMPWLQEGLLVSTGPKWFARRKIITPTFHFSILEQFVKIFEQENSILVEKLKIHSMNGEPFDVHHYVALAALDSISESALGIKIHAQSDPECAYVKAISEISYIVTYRYLKLLYIFPLIFATIGYKLKRRQDKVLHKLHSFTENIIKERREVLKKKLNNTKIQEELENDIGIKKRTTFLDVLLAATINGRPLSNVDIREEVDTFTFEGHDTTSAGVSFTLYLLARHPEVQQKVYEEIKEIFGDDFDKTATYNDLQQLKYLECAIKESLRLYPPVPLIGRMLDEDLTLNGRTLLAGSSVNILVYHSMRNPKVFPEPEKYIPERHRGNNSAEISNPYSFVPFSAGPRNCIGQKFAMLEMKSMISKIIKSYELMPIGEDIKPYIAVVLRSRTGVQIGLKPRKR